MHSYIHELWLRQEGTLCDTKVKTKLSLTNKTQGWNFKKCIYGCYKCMKQKVLRNPPILLIEDGLLCIWLYIKTQYTHRQ